MRTEPVFASPGRYDVPAETAPSGFGRLDYAALGCAVFAGLAILINALFLQTGPHPGPIFSNRNQSTPASAPAPSPAQRDTPAAVTLPRPRPAENEPAMPARPSKEAIADIQKELSRRGFYEGAADGILGARTDAAIRDFEQAAGVKIGSEPNEAMLKAIARSGVKAAALQPQAPAAPRPPDPIAEIIAPPAKRVTAVQRVLSDFGYGQIRPSGNFDRDTQDAIEQFERARKLPVTRQITPSLLRELSAMSGRPLD